MGIDSPSKPGWLGALNPARYLGLARKNILEEPQDAPPVEEGEEVERTDTPIRQTALGLEPSTPTTQRVATTKSTTLKSPGQVASSSAKPPKRKRVASSEREDVYVVPAGTAADESRPEKELADRPATRRRRVGKAKSPLTIPKTSKGSIDPRQVRYARNDYATETAEVGASADLPDSMPGIGVLNPTEPEKPKRKRGRPRKDKTPQSGVVREAVVTTPSQITTAGPAVAKNVGTASHPAIALEASGNVDTGISPILLNPSPIKVVRQDVRGAAPTAKQQQKPFKPKAHVQASKALPELSADEDDGEIAHEDKAQENADVLDESEVELGEEAADQLSTEPQKTPFDPQLVDKMWEMARRVGKTHDKKNNIWSRDSKTEKLLTSPGKQMITRLKILISSYEKMQTSKESRDKRDFREAHKEVEKMVDSLSQKTKVILSERFNPDCDIKKAKATLTDLYFNVLPELIYALKQAVAVYDNEGSMETAALQEILKLAYILHDLANGAVTQRKEVQPRPAKSASYQISLPTRSNIPKIRELQKSIFDELVFREREEERAREELQRPELQRRLREELEREAAEISRKRAERRRLQGKSWWDVRNDFLPDPWKRVLQTDIARLEANRKSRSRQESVELGYPRMGVVERRRARSEESHSQSDQDVERISVFPANNVKENSSMSSLSKEDTLVFIDCMRFEHGKANSL
jgi:hypothetical protein